MYILSLEIHIPSLEMNFSGGFAKFLYGFGKSFRAGRNLLPRLYANSSPNSSCSSFRARFFSIISWNCSVRL